MAAGLSPLRRLNFSQAPCRHRRPLRTARVILDACGRIDKVEWPIAELASEFGFWAV